jgi:hypothetical protein
MAFNGADGVLAASAVKAMVTKGIGDLGGLTIGPDVSGTAFGWNAYGGPDDCFTYYKLVWSATNPEPSYLGANDGAIAVEGRLSSATTATVPSGTQWFRLQAIRATSTGKFVVAQTAAVQYAVP